MFFFVNEVFLHLILVHPKAPVCLIVNFDTIRFLDTFTVKSSYLWTSPFLLNLLTYFSMYKYMILI